MTREDLKQLLASHSDEAFLRQYLFDSAPWIMQRDASVFESWRAGVLSEIQLPDASLHIVGSAATGFSLSPYKPGREFRPLRPDFADASDIDLALVSSGLFTQCWESLLHHDRRRALRLTSDGIDRMRQDVYFGFVNDKILPKNTPAARATQSVAIAAGRKPPLRGHRVSIRVYRRFEDLEGYHRSSLRSLRAELERQ